MPKKSAKISSKREVLTTITTGAKAKKKRSAFDMRSIKKAIEAKLKAPDRPKKQQILEQRSKFAHVIKGGKQKIVKGGKWIQTGVEGFDALLEKGIPKGASVLVCGGPGSGKTIFCLQTLAYAASRGEKCLYMTFEESEQRLLEHMADFGWDGAALIKKGNLVVKRYNPYDITRQVEAMLEQQKGELLIDVKPLLFPVGFKPDRVVIDSLSAIAAAFVGKEETYRIYIEQLFKIFEDVDATSFLISETAELPHKLTASGVEEFLADGVIVIYNLKHGNIRESAIECLKLRGAAFKKKIVAMQIMSGVGLEVYSEQEVFSEV